MSLGRLTDQDELKQLFEYYKEADLATSETKPFDKFNAIEILKARDGAGVYFDSYLALLGRESKLRKEAILGKDIASRIVSIAAYFLAQVADPAHVPDEIRICLAVCHDQAHWTGLIVRVKSFKAFYEKIHKDCFSKDLYKDAGTEQVLHNRAKNAIYKYLGIVLSSKADEATSEVDKAKIVFRAIGRDQLQIDHFDSMNSTHYSSRIDKSLREYTRVDETTHTRIIAKPNHLACSQQKGNTCGDHTVINLFMGSMYGEQPIINADSAESKTSKDLRKFTDAIGSEKHRKRTLIRMAGELIANPGRVDLRASVKLAESQMVAQFNEQLDALVKDLHRKCPQHYQVLLEAAKNNDIGDIDGLAEQHSDDENIVAGCDIAKILAEIYQGEHSEKTAEIFGPMNQVDRKVYGNLAIFQVEEYLSHFEELDSLVKDNISTQEHKSASTSEKKSARTESKKSDDGKEQLDISSGLRGEDLAASEASWLEESEQEKSESTSDEETRSDEETQSDAASSAREEDETELDSEQEKALAVAEEAERKENEAKRIENLNTALGVLKQKIKQLDDYGQELQDAKETKKGGQIRDLAGALKKLTENFAEKAETKSANEFNVELKYEFEREINKRDLSQYRFKGASSVGKIVGHILLALTGVGLFVIAGRLIYSKARYDRALFFGMKPKTTSERLVDEVESKLTKLKTQGKFPKR